MPLAPGTRLGSYEITAPLGSGGMGEVYRARDGKLKREVALKVLPPLFVNDAQRMLRFEREAQVLASLNHPNIAHIHGVEEAQGIRALVMELVEGSTLAERIAQGPLPLEDSIPLAKQIAEGLEYAHERGVIHRDLKPANIKVTPDGQVKILDFGLAKALEGQSSEGDISASPTISIAATSAGVLLGTAGYMSPEQAKGKAVDRRADIWAFDCVFFEMLTGNAAFAGETITDKLAAVVRAEPELSQLPEKTPVRIRELLQRCLMKDPKQRLQAIGEARIALENYLANPSAGATATEVIVVGKRNWEPMLLTGLLLVSAVAAVIGYLYWKREPEKRRVGRTQIRPTPNSGFLFGGEPTGIALSPDGLHLAYIALNAEGKAMLWVRQIDSLQAHTLAGTLDATYPFWSHDSRYIGFFAQGKLKKIEASGGPALTLCDAPLPRGGAWNQDGVIVFAPTLNGPLQKVSESGGTPVPITRLDASKGELTHRWPCFLPDGHHFLYVAGTPLASKENLSNAIYVGSLDGSGGSKFLMHTHSSAEFALGHILFLREGVLMAQPFDASRLELAGEALVVAEGVAQESLAIASLHSTISVSQNGLLAYPEGGNGAGRELVWFDRNGKKLGDVAEANFYSGLRISPDGKRLAFTLLSGSFEIWTYDLARGVRTRLTFGDESVQGNLYAVWSPDGQRTAYTSVRNGKYGFYEKPADGSGREELLLEATGEYKVPTDWSPDGRILTYQTVLEGINAIWLLPMSGDRKPYPFSPSQSHQTNLAFAPDGHWAAYCSTESGERKVYIVPFPGPGGKWQVSPAGGCFPRWRRDGKELFYVSADNKIMAVGLANNGSGMVIGKVNPLFETRTYRATAGPFDVTGDGQRFIVAYDIGLPNASIALVENWDAELKKK